MIFSLFFFGLMNGPRGTSAHILKTAAYLTAHNNGSSRFN